MRLTKVVLHGFRKLVGTECQFAGKLTAVVGANEAGKSSLLEALMSAQSDEAIPASAHPYGLAVTPETIAIELWYRLATEDLQALGEIDSDDEPNYYVVTKSYSGQRDHFTVPRIRRRTAQRQAAVSAVGRFAGTVAARSMERDLVYGGGPGDRFDAVNKILVESPLDSEVTDDDWEVVASLIDDLGGEDTSARGRQFAGALRAWQQQMSTDDPHDQALVLFDKREPSLAIFDSAERNLRSSYALDDVVEDPPAALRNMADLAQLDLVALHGSYVAGDVGAIETATEAAAAALDARLIAAYKQSAIHVRMLVDDGTLHILAKTDGPRYSQVAEHSDGLRTFMALTAFAHSLQDESRPLVLLIDEAEQHLHYDAQADLVRMLERQSLAAQVIYTTHSAGCLPSDLGTGVRGIAPVESDGRSAITNSLWGMGPGFTPLLMALGAGAAAFAPSRYAVLGEGATEMLLLPSLVREAIGEVDKLDYQVTAGLAEVGNSSLQDLELEAPRVAYVLDGDKGGDSHFKRLCGSGVPAKRIVQLGGAGSGLTIESLIREDLHLEAINEVLAQLQIPDRMTKVQFTARATRNASVTAWCRKKGCPEPGKPAVAVALLETARERRLLTREGAGALRNLHQAILTALEIPVGR